MGKVTWTSEGERWVKDIYDYIAKDNPSAAQRVVQGIYKRAEILERFPEIGQVYEGSGEQPVRILLYGHFRITYSILPNRDVDILAVYHGALDIRRFLGEENASD